MYIYLNISSQKILCKDKEIKQKRNKETKLLDFIDHNFTQTTDSYPFMITFILHHLLK